MGKYIFVFAALLTAVAVPAEAAFIGSTELPLTGPSTTRAPLSYKGQLTYSLEMGQAEENSGQLFFEKSTVITGSDLTLTKGGVVPVGTSVESYILHFDPVGASSSPVWELHETLTFDQTVLGVIFDTTTAQTELSSTDSILGLGPNYYQTGYYHRKFEEDQEKWNDIAILGNSVTFNLFTNTSMDEVRIVTTPVPGAVLLGVLGLGAAGLKLRKYA